MEHDDVLAKFEQMLRQNGNGFSQTRDQVATLTNQVNLITQNVANLTDRFTSEVTNLVKSINEIKAEFTSKRQSPLVVVLSVVPTIGALMGALFWLMSSQTSAAISPIVTQLTVLQNSALAMQQDIRKQEDASRRSEIADENSRTNRTQMGDEIHKLRDELSRETATLRSFMSDTSARWMEQETQFKGLSNLWNQGRADQLRFNGIIWQKDFGVPYPPEAYYPNMYNEHPTPMSPGPEK